jgi:hypothetical protein
MVMMSGGGDGVQSPVDDYGQTPNKLNSTGRSFSRPFSVVKSTQFDPFQPRKREYKSISIKNNSRVVPPFLIKIEPEYINSVQD